MRAGAAENQKCKWEWQDANQHTRRSVYVEYEYRAWRKQVVVQHEKNGNDALRCVCANNELHFWKAVNHLGFSRNQSVRARSAAQAGWSLSLSSSKSYCLARKKPLAPEQEPFLFHFVNLNPLINAAALDLYKHGAALLFFLCVVCVLLENA